MASPSAKRAERPSGDPVVDRLADFVLRSERLLVLTGAGCSTDSGIPDYRDEAGEWKHRRPVQYADFVRSPEVRRRYWARSMAGWPAIAGARPNGAHRALARLEALDQVSHLITQNVDGLHQRAGSRRVVDLHGRLDRVVCLDCGDRSSRHHLQRRLLDLNGAGDPETPRPHRLAPDGDAEVSAPDPESFAVPGCLRCGGVLKPGVVFFGEAVPPRRTARALEKLGEADGLLVVGSSLMVWSGYRFVKLAAERGLPVAAVNLGRTRADDLLRLKIRRSCTEVLPRLLDRLA